MFSSECGFTMMPPRAGITTSTDFEDDALFELKDDALFELDDDALLELDDDALFELFELVDVRLLLDTCDEDLFDLLTLDDVVAPAGEALLIDLFI